MKVGYSLTDRADDNQDDSFLYNSNSTNYVPPSTAEGAILLVVAVLGGLGNIFAMIITLVCPSFRHMSSAFLFHHCLLDAMKSVFCIPFGYSLLIHTEISHCDVLGAMYILLMTVSAYNLLALLVNEEYQCSYANRRNYHKNSDGCCIAFGVVIIWFTTVLLHLGVAFLPGSPEFSKEVGNCVYRYGVTKNYVIHALWVILVTGAIVVAAFSFFHFYRKLKSNAESRKWTFLHKSLSSLSPHNPIFSDQAQEVHYEFDDLSAQKAMLQTRRYLRRIIIMMLMVVSFVLCWYPLFLLILIDVHYQQPPHIYRILMIVAWIHPITTPVFCGVIYYDMSVGEKITKDVYSTALPMTFSSSSEVLRHEINQMYGARGGGAAGPERADGVGGNMAAVPGMGFCNDNFEFTPNHVDSPISPARHRVRAGGSETDSTHCDFSANCDSLDISAAQESMMSRCESNDDDRYDFTPHCETIINYNTEEGGCQTLIM